MSASVDFKQERAGMPEFNKYNKEEPTCCYCYEVEDECGCNTDNTERFER